MTLRLHPADPGAASAPVLVRQELLRVVSRHARLRRLGPIVVVEPDEGTLEITEELCHTPAWQGIPVLALVGRRLTPEQKRLLGRHTAWIFRKGTHSLEELQGKILELVEGLAAAGL